MSLVDTVIRGEAPPARGGSERPFGLSRLFDVASWAPAPPVTPERARQVATAYACIDLISSTIAALPRRIVRRGERAARRREVRTPGLRHIWGRPNPVMTAVEFWSWGLGSLLTGGNMYAWLGGLNAMGRPTELWPLHPDRVQVGLASDGTKVFRLDDDDRLTFGRDRVLHVIGPSDDGMRGQSPIAAVRQSFALTLAAQEFGLRYFAQGSHMSGVLQYDQELTEAQADAIKNTWKKKSAGLEHVGDVLILDRGAKFERVGIPPDEAQYLETRAFQREEIVQIFRVPPHMIGLTTKSTSWGTGIEQQSIGFVVYTLLPWIVRLEQAISDALLPEPLELKFVVNGLLRGDVKSRFDAYSRGRQWGTLSAEDVRELEDLPPRGIPDDYLSPLNMERLTVPPPAGPGIADTPSLAQADARERLALTVRRMVGAGPAPAALPTSPPPLVAEARCPACNQLLGRNVRGADLWCDKCNHEVPFGSDFGDGPR